MVLQHGLQEIDLPEQHHDALLELLQRVKRSRAIIIADLLRVVIGAVTKSKTTTEEEKPANRKHKPRDYLQAA